MKNLLLVPLGALALLCAVACQKEATYEVKEAVNAENLALSAGLSVSVQNLDFNTPIPSFLTAIGLPAPTLHSGKAALGRVLFYDKNLSSDRSVSCASCHKQEFAFGDNTAFSKGVNGHLGTRNSMALGNVPNFAAQYAPIVGQTPPQLLWDGRAADIVNQAPLAFTNPHEMDLEMTEVVDRVREADYYSYFFYQAYGDVTVSETRILEALQEFVGSIGSCKSKLDVALEKVNGDLFGSTTQVNPMQVQSQILGHYSGSSTVFDTIPADTVILPLQGFSDLELRGRTLFFNNCSKCHTPLRPAQEVFMACNGLEMNYLDRGLGAITGRPEDVGVFKSPSLRNVAFTAPYMHDGRFKTLEEVLDFYSTGIQNHPNLHPLLRQPDGSTQLNLTAQEKKDIIAFLKTMSAEEILTDQRFANPFN